MKPSKYRLSPGQRILAGAAIVVLVILSVSSFTSSNRALKLATQSNSATTQSAAIIITQRETLVYGIRLSEWLNGSIPRRDLQITRALLAQRLQVVDSAGVSIGSRARPDFIQTLRDSDALVASAPAGYLPASLQKSLQAKGKQILENLISEGHQLINDYEQTVSLQIKSFAEAQKGTTTRNLYLLFALIILTGVLLVWSGFNLRAQYKRDRAERDYEQEHLKGVRKELGAAQETVLALKSLNEAKNEFVATINHELRTPLTSIIGYIEILKEFSTSEGNANFHKYLDVMDRNASVLLELVESILLLSALEATDAPTETRQCDLVTICERAFVLLQLEIESASLNVEATYDLRDQFIVQGNENQLSQVFRNLISNAVKFSPPGSTVRISITRHVNSTNRQFVWVEVRDEGIGIPEGDLQHLFSRFFRASNATERDIPGSGLGLAIVDRIVKLHQGEISVESTVGKGTTFRVGLPVGVSPVEEMVMNKREGVLVRSIRAIEDASPKNLEAVAHETGGAIGFYTFVAESQKALDFSRWLKANPKASEKEIEERKAELVELLHLTLNRIRVEVSN